MATADFTGTRTTRVHGIPDALADALADALLGLREVTPPDTNNFDDLTHIIATASRVIQHLDAFRELAIVAADDTSPHADRKAIAAAAGIPPSRLYRILDRHGRPTVRNLERATQAMRRLGETSRETAASMNRTRAALEKMHLED
jgi:hypothetical protein